MAVVLGLLLVGCVIFLYILYNQNIDQKEIIDSIKLRYKEKSDMLNNKDIQVAQLNEKLAYLTGVQARYDAINLKLIDSNRENEGLKTKLEQQKLHNEDKQEYIIKGEERLKNQFAQISQEITQKNTQMLDNANQKSMKDIITPMQTQLMEFKKRVEHIYDNDSKDRAKIGFELQRLKELNQKMSQDAINLTRALTHDNKTQGSWGEVVLEKVLESSGLRKEKEYKREVRLKDDKGNLYRPDVVVYLPENRHIIIDAKSSLIAYNQYINQHNEENKQKYLAEHILSIKTHIKGLASRKYEKLQDINSLDFVFMFVPIESALLLALEHDVSLFDNAFNQKIILVSPSTLLVALRAVENSWRYEKQAKNIHKIYNRAEKLYDKFVSFTDDMLNIGKGLQRAQTSYDNTVNKLSGTGGLVRQAQMLKKVSNIKSRTDIDKKLLEENS